MTLREQIAKAMYEAPDPSSIDSHHMWPPAHPADLKWWLSRADAAVEVVEAVLKPKRCGFEELGEASHGTT